MLCHCNPTTTEAVGESIATADRTLRGIVLRVLSVICVSVMIALVKLASLRGVNTAEVMFYRSVLAVPVLLVWAAAGPGMAVLATKRPLAHVWRGIISVCSMFLTFQSLAMLPLAEATTLIFTAPLFATILSWLVLREAVGWHQLGAVAVGFSGVLVVLGPNHLGSGTAMIGVFVALGAAFAQAGVAITVRQLQNSEHVAATVFWLMVCTTAIGAILLLFFGRMHDWHTFAILAGVAVTGLVAQLLMTASLGLAPVSVVMPFDYIQLVGATLFGWLLFDMVPPQQVYAGAVLIVAAGAYTVLRERRRGIVEATLPLAD